MPVERKINLTNYASEIANELTLLVATEAVTEAKSRVRVDFGQLKGSITREQLSNAKYIIYSNVEHAAAQEYGIPEIPNYGFTPYLRPGAQVAGSDKSISRNLKIAERIAVNRSKT
jgi:hypothetical protein